MDLLRCRVHEVVCFIRWIFRFSKSSRHRSRIVNLFGEGANKADFLNGAESSDVVLVKKIPSDHDGRSSPVGRYEGD